MKAQKLKNLFLRQSYLDSWDEYQISLKSGRTVKWDYIVLTASNEEQAKTYRMQLNDRLANGFLQKKTEYVVLSDPNGDRVGSGGATFNVLKYIKENSRYSSLVGKRILVIHSGGDSKRVPQYSACGKLFSPVPRELPDGRRSTLFDEFVISMSSVPSRLKDGMLVLSGDVLLLFNSLQIDFHFGGAAAISIKEDVETGKDHGVFLSDESGSVLQFLHKNSVDKLKSVGAVNEHGNVDIDTGAIVMDGKMVEDLYSLIDTQEKFSRFVNGSARISFYADFLYPLAEDSTEEQYYKEAPEGDFTPELMECRKLIWKTLRKYRIKMISLSPAEFIHFGTTKELLNLVTEEISMYEFLDWKKQVLVNNDINVKCSVSNSIIDNSVIVDESSYVEDSIISGNSIIGKNCVISNVELKDVIISDNTVVHGLKLKNGTFVARVYNTDTNPKINDFWNEKTFTISDSVQNSYLGIGNGKTSLCESFNNANTEHIIKWHKRIENEIRVRNFLYALKNRVQVDMAKKCFGQQGLSETHVRLLLEKAKKTEFDIKTRIYYYLSKYFDGVLGEQYENMCFAEIQNIILNKSLNSVAFNDKLKISKDEVVIKLPVRVNWGGGWSDTPPYCNENGGTVLNIAIKLRGELPVHVIIRKTDGNKIILESADSGNKKVFTSIKELQDSNNPFDPFALHKAALIACGVIPENDDLSVELITKSLGGGFYMSTEVIGVPRGSGLGTSSILSAACVKGLFEFFNENISDGELFFRTMCMEQLMSTGGGWQDQVGGVLPGLKFITSNKGIEQDIKVSKVNLSLKTKQELQDRFVLIYTGQRRLARNLLREVVGKYIGGESISKNVLDEIQQVAALMRFELERGNVDGFAKLLNEHWELSKQLDSGSTNTCIDQIFFSIDDLIDGKFISGAGGGGFLQAILKKNITKIELQERLSSVFQNSGVDVWNCELIF